MELYSPYELVECSKPRGRVTPRLTLEAQCKSDTYSMLKFILIGIKSQIVELRNWKTNIIASEEFASGCSFAYLHKLLALAELTAAEAICISCAERSKQVWDGTGVYHHATYI